MLRRRRANQAMMRRWHPQAAALQEAAAAAQAELQRAQADAAARAEVDSQPGGGYNCSGCRRQGEKSAAASTDLEAAVAAEELAEDDEEGVGAGAAGGTPSHVDH